jgi:hypothetical protein
MYKFYHLSLYIMGLIFVDCVSSQAFAKCFIYGNPQWSVNRSINADVYYKVHDFCNIWYTNQGTVFTSLRALSAPKNGKLTKNGPFKWYYKAKPGFVGHDKFVVELCGDDGRLKGCAVLSYDMEVVDKPFN